MDNFFGNAFSWKSIKRWKQNMFDVDLKRIEYQYFTKGEQVPKKIPENRGAGVCPHPCFRASTSCFVIY